MGYGIFGVKRLGNLLCTTIVVIVLEVIVHPIVKENSVEGRALKGKVANITLFAIDIFKNSTYTRMAYLSRGDAWIFMTMGTTHCTNMKIQALLLEWYAIRVYVESISASSALRSPTRMCMA